ncbi:hypothetical protein FRC04_006293 [Tulasnella sp. 424]|nr:hypothetical protein FRC04_006293 [Tulasnella sp. 424]KAG8980347.1 hypothetical protein FRC05_005977 [Tulasnella sp. 425]
MAPTRPSVTSVVRDARANNPSQRPSAIPSAPFVANVSAHDDIGHPQNTLSQVPNPTPPPPKPSAATSCHTPEQRRPHVVPGVTRVPIQINEAAVIKNIEKMTTTTWSLLDKWPLGSLFGLLGGGREPQQGEAALPAKVAPKAAEEERSEDEYPPPPYSFK